MERMERERSPAIRRHQECPDCGSSTGLTIYADGHTYCFSCHTHHNGNRMSTPDDRASTPAAAVAAAQERALRDAFPEWTAEYRGLRPDTLHLYGIAPLEDGGFACTYRDSAGVQVAQKFRRKDKRIHWAGRAQDVAGLGEHLAGQRTQAVAICEGEMDAPSVYQATSGRVVGVSVPNGAGGAAKHVAARLSFYLAFPAVYVCLDMDGPGQKAAKEVADLFPPGKVKVVMLPAKDANDTLNEHGPLALRTAVENAKEYRPDGIRAANQYAGLALQAPQRQSIPYPFKAFNDKTKLYDNQLVVVIAGTGVGKTSIMRAMALGLMESGVKVGWLGLEELVEESIYHFVGQAAGIELHHRETYSDLTAEQLVRVKDAERFVTQSGRLELFDHFGSLTDEVILNRMRYMVKGLGCRVLFLDHLSIISSGQGHDVRALDAMVTKLRSFCASTRATVIAANHLSRDKASGRDFEDGDVPNLQDIRGSHAIAHLADTVWAMGRKGDSDQTRVFCRKNRIRGRKGYTCTLTWHEETQQYEETYDDFPG